MVLGSDFWYRVLNILSLTVMNDIILMVVAPDISLSAHHAY